jgi:hypothetical protein
MPGPPTRSSLTQIRQRCGLDVFQRFFEQIVDVCKEPEAMLTGH